MSKVSKSGGKKRKSLSVKEYWSQQARLARTVKAGIKVYDRKKDLFADGRGGGGTLKDHNLRQLEIARMGEYLKRGESVLDVGCGNGYSTLRFALERGVRIVGVDYSEEMIANAQASLKKVLRKHPRLKNKVEFLTADALKLDEVFPKRRFDTVLTIRCLINLQSWEDQKRAIAQVHGVLKRRGRFLMLESSLLGLERLNSVRRSVGLHDIKVSWHNLFFDEKKLLRYLSRRFEILDVDNFCSTYMLISRALHPMLWEPDYERPINRAALYMPNMGDYGYNKIFVLRKKQGGASG